ncbi:MAG: hypothetical protein HY763_01845 [Planctomycetes bacterium]|nr:hypothetical protein [Planctomycetota bacterium]
MPGADDDKSQWLRAFRRESAGERWTLLRSEIAWSWGRLLAFVSACVLGWVSWDSRPRAVVLAILCLVCFGICVLRHTATRRRRRLADDLLLMIDEAVARVGGRLHVVRGSARPADPPTAAALFDPPLADGPVAELTEQERGDLDLYGPSASLFGLLNRTSVSAGARRLRDMLEHPSLDAVAIQRRQQAVRPLDEGPEQRLRLMAGSAALRRWHKETDGLIAGVRTAVPLLSPGWVTALRAWGVASFFFSLWTLVQAGRGQYGWAAAWLLLIALNGYVLYRMRSTLRAALEPWSALQPALRGCRDATELAVHMLPEGESLGELKTQFRVATDAAVFPRLERRVAWTGSAGMVHALLNVTAFWDVHLAASILGVVLPHRELMLGAIAALAELDALCSLASFAWEQPWACYPQPAATPCLRIDAGVHPLLNAAGAVPNDVELTPSLRTWIVTGSNMAGKSTLLRMIGVNVLLAQVGTIATARSMSWSPLRLMTDLRVSDCLADSESYFLAEVRHVHRMVTPPGDGVTCLGLIDEPFRGTNSQEQVAASLAVGEHLIASPHLFVIATHDQRLTELADDVQARNVHFREDLDGDAMVFDYRLRPGPAQTRNALLVLERVGYPAALLNRARARLTEGL